MTTRYFKATDGTRTVFRATNSGKVYTSAKVQPISFSTGPARPGFYPAVEVNKAEYDRLVARKNDRQKVNGSDWMANSPQESWIDNAAVEANLKHARRLQAELRNASLKGG